MTQIAEQTRRNIQQQQNAMQSIVESSIGLWGACLKVQAELGQAHAEFFRTAADSILNGLNGGMDPQQQGWRPRADE